MKEKEQKRERVHQAAGEPRAASRQEPVAEPEANPEPEMADESEAAVKQEQAEKENTEEVDMVESLRKALADEKERAAEYLASWKRAQADFVNYKRRTEQEKADSGSSAVALFLCGTLPAIDDLERAIVAVPPELETDEWVKGVKMVWRKMKAALEAQGLSQISCVGEEFDPRVHEAVLRCPGKEGTIINEYEKGYKLYERLVRPSKVSVGEGEPESKEE